MGGRGANSSRASNNKKPSTYDYYKNRPMGTRSIYYNQTMTVRKFNGGTSVVLESQQGVPRMAQKGEWYVYRVGGSTQQYIPKGDPSITAKGTQKKGVIEHAGIDDTVRQLGGHKPVGMMAWGRYKSLK